MKFSLKFGTEIAKKWFVGTTKAITKQKNHTKRTMPLVAGFMLVLATLLQTNVPVAQAGTATFTTAGGHIWEVPNGVTEITVGVWGAGGGARDADDDDSRGGAGGGAYAQSTFSVTPGQDFNLYVGTGGPTNTSGSFSSRNGEDSWFSSSNPGPFTVKAQGGRGGADSAGDGDGGAGDGGDTNGSLSIGQIEFRGGHGGARDNGDAGGGGGGSAGPNGIGGNGGNGGSTTGGSGGIADNNGGDGGNGGKGGDDTSGSGRHGQNGFAPGGGGGGGAERSNTTSGTGANGQVRITWADPQENTAELCSDQVDNDGDQLVDLNDPDCEQFIPQTYSISGMKFNDLDNDGIKDGGEPGLPNWEIWLDVGANETVDSTTLTDQNGFYIFNGLANGPYIVGETQQGGWTQTYPIQPNYHSVEVDDANLESKDFGNHQNSEEEVGVTIVAHKIVCNSEANLPNLGNGGEDIGPSTAQNFVDNSDGQCWLQSGWEFQWGPQNAYDPGDTLIGPANEPWQTLPPTNGDGMTTITLSSETIGESNDLWFREVLQDGYIAFTHDQNGESNADDVSAEMYCHIDVLNYDNYDRIDNVQVGQTYNCVAWNVATQQQPITSDISGTKFNDHNGDGVRDEGDEGLAGWTIYIDENANGVFDDGELFDITNADGNYLFEGLLPGPYIIREVSQAGWVQTSPNEGAGSQHEVVLGSTDQPGLDFGNHEQTCDAQLELVINGGFEEPEVTTEAQWDIFGLPTSGWGGAWVNPNENTPMMELQEGVNGWLAHSGDQYTELDSDQDGPSGDMNGEDGLIRLTQNLTTVAGRSYTVSFWTSPRPGLGTDENVTEVWWDGILQDTITEDGTANSNTVWTQHTYTFVATGTTTELAFAGGGIPDSLGAFLDDVSVMAICPPLEQEEGGYVTGLKWGDLDGDGIWDENEVGLGGWTIYVDLNDNGSLDESEPSTITGDGDGISDEGESTDALGRYNLHIQTDGTYKIREVGQSNWTQTYPIDPNYHEVSVSNGMALDYNYNFGNQYNQSGGDGDEDTCSNDISGVVYNDTNHNEQYDSTDEVLSDWTVYLDIDNDNALSAGDISTQTDSNGHYQFTNLPNGTYIIREIVKSGWHLVSPDPDDPDAGEYTMTVNCNQELAISSFDVTIQAVPSNGTDVNFGNVPDQSTGGGGGTTGGGGGTPGGGGSTPTEEVSGDQTTGGGSTPTEEVKGEQTLPVTGQSPWATLIAMLVVSAAMIYIRKAQPEEK